MKDDANPADFIQNLQYLLQIAEGESFGAHSQIEYVLKLHECSAASLDVAFIQTQVLDSELADDTKHAPS